MKHKKLILPLAVAALLCGGFLSRYTVIGPHCYPRNTVFLDVRGDRLNYRQYHRLCRALPDCEILWELPFQDTFLPLDTAELTIEHLTMQEAAELQDLQALKSVHAEACQDYDALLTLQSLQPQAVISYYVPISGQRVSSRQRTVHLKDVNAEQLREGLSRLPRLQHVILEGRLPAAQQLSDLCRNTGASLSYSPDGQHTFPVRGAVQLIDARHKGISQTDLIAAADCNPDIHFLWDFEFAGKTNRTNCYELDLSDCEITSVADVEAILPYFYNVHRVDMSRTGFDSETMDALDRRYPDIRFLWEVHLGHTTLRTDADCFAPIKIGDFVMDEDLEDLKYCRDMVCIDLGHNYIFDISWAADMPNLTYLVLADCPLSDISPLTGLKNLRFLELFMSNVKDYSPLLTCTGLEDLNLSYTYGTPDPVYQMTWLKHLWWGQYFPLSDSQGNPCREQLPLKLPDTEVHCEYGSSTGGNWRKLDNYFAMRDIMGMFYLFG